MTQVATPIRRTDQTEERRLATVEQVRAVTPIPDADAIESVTVRNWTVVVKRGQFAAGDRVVYFEIDTALPLSDERFAFLAPRGRATITVNGVERDVHVLKTARLRGVYSQGLVIPADETLADAEIGQDVADRFDVVKFEPPLPAGGSGQIAGVFPSHLGRKTDSERAQNFTAQQWATVQTHPWIATEKVDGTSVSIFCDHDGTAIVAGRNWRIADGDNLYWNALRAALPEALTELSPGEGVQAEIVGPGIQGNRLGLSAVRVLVFSFLRNREAQEREQWPAWARDAAVPIVDIEIPETVEQMVEEVDGMKSRVSPGRLAEGIVFHHAHGTALAELDNRSTWKVISNKFLVKSGG